MEAAFFDILINTICCWWCKLVYSSLIFNVKQVFTPDGATKVALDDICQRCLVYSDSFKPNVDLVDMAKKINSVRFDVMLELKTAKIDIF